MQVFVSLRGFFWWLCCHLKAILSRCPGARLNESIESRTVMQYYRIYVRLKRGGQATGRELHTGSPPLSGTQVNVPLISGRTVKARIGLPNTKHGEAAGTAVVTVDADEI